MYNFPFLSLLEFIEGVHPTGPALINLFLPGTRVIRGPDWQWQNQVILCVCMYVMRKYTYQCVCSHI